MLSRKLNVAAAVLALAVSSIHQAAAQREGRKAPDLSGRVAAISADGKTLTLEETAAARGEEPKKSEFKLADTTKIEFTGAFKDVGRTLKVGDWVAVYLENGAPGVVQVTAMPDV